MQKQYGKKAYRVSYYFLLLKQIIVHLCYELLSVVKIAVTV